jgi:histone H3/H4
MNTKTATKKTSATKTSAGRGHARHRNYRSNATYITKLLKKNHADTGISRGALQTVEGMIRVFQTELAKTVNCLLETTRSRTLTSRDIQSAVRLALPGELAKHAVSRGTKAISVFNAGSGKGGGKAGQADLTFPPTRMLNQLMTEIAGRTRRSSTAGVYYAAVVEYLVSEVLDLASNAARDSKAKRVIPRHLLLSIANDEELNHVFPPTKTVIPHGGVVPNVHQILLGSKKGKSKAAADQQEL